MLLRAISIAFCKLGSPAGSSFVRSLSDLSTSCGFPANERKRDQYTDQDENLPDISPMRSPIPLRIPTTPI